MLTKREVNLLKMIEDEIHAREEEICAGALTLEQYKDMTGFVRGLKLTTEFLQYLGQQD